MVTVEHPLVRRHIVHAVVVAHRGRYPIVIELQHPFRDVFAIEPIRDQINGHRRRHEPYGVDALAPTECECRERERARDGDYGPEKVRNDPVHRDSLSEINTREARSRGLRGPFARSRVRLYPVSYTHLTLPTSDLV